MRTLLLACVLCALVATALAKGPKVKKAAIEAPQCNAKKCEVDDDCPATVGMPVLCMAGECTAFAVDKKLGEACNYDVDDCAEGYCAEDTLKCVVQVGKGCACSDDAACMDSLNCEGGDGDKCQFDAALSVGDTCDDDEACASGLCQDGKCVGGHAGDPCQQAGSCGAHGFCDEMNGVCRALPARCEADEECHTLQACNRGACVDLLSLKDGSACDNDVACSGGSCVAGKCKDVRGHKCSDDADCGSGMTDEPPVGCACTSLDAKGSRQCTMVPFYASPCFHVDRAFIQCADKNGCVSTDLFTTVQQEGSCVHRNCAPEAFNAMCCGACRNNVHGYNLDCQDMKLSSSCDASKFVLDLHCDVWEKKHGKDLK